MNGYRYYDAPNGDRVNVSLYDTAPSRVERFSAEVVHDGYVEELIEGMQGTLDTLAKSRGWTLTKLVAL